MDRSKLHSRLSIGCHVVESLFFASFTMILLVGWSLWWIIVEDLMLMDYLVVVVVIDVHCFVTLALRSWLLLLLLGRFFTFHFLLALNILFLLFFLLLLSTLFILRSSIWFFAFLCFKQKTTLLLLMPTLFTETAGCHFIDLLQFSLWLSRMMLFTLLMC